MHKTIFQKSLLLIALVFVVWTCFAKGLSENVDVNTTSTIGFMATEQPDPVTTTHPEDKVESEEADNKAGIDEREVEDVTTTESTELENDTDEEDEDEEDTEESKIKKDEEDEEDDDEDNEDDEDDEELANQICTAGYFVDKITPEDYPQQMSKDVKHINETIERLNRMYNFTQQMVQKLSPFIKEIGLRITDFMYETDLDPECMGAMFRVISALNQRKPWASNFLDASGQFLSGGFQQGKFVSLGEFDQCLDTVSTDNGNNDPLYGKYCLVRPVIPVPEDTHIKKGEQIARLHMPSISRFLNDEYLETYLGLYKFYRATLLQIGVCMPHKCQAENVQSAINQFLVRKTGLSIQIGPKCSVLNDEVKWNVYQIVSVSVLMSLFLLVLCSTIYEIVYRLREDTCLHLAKKASIQSNDSLSLDDNPIHKRRFQRLMSKAYLERPAKMQLLTTFSIIRNTRTLFDIDESRFPQIDTMRLLFVLYFFITNAYYYTLIFAPMIVKRFYVNGPMQFFSEKKYFFIRMYYLHDMFLAICGVSIALNYHRKKFNLFRFFIQNYIQYILPILASIGLIYIIPLIGNGPLWHLFEENVSRQCQSSLWSNIFFINNLNKNIEDICNIPTAFVSMVFQLRLFAPLLLYFVTYLRPKRASYLLFAPCLIFTVIHGLPRVLFNFHIPYEYKVMKNYTEIRQSLMFYLFHPIVHSAPFVLGLAIGRYILVMRKESRCSRAREINITGFISLILTIASFLYIENVNILQPYLPIYKVLVLVTIGRIFLISFLCWILYASILGHIHIVNRFLCSIAFRPLSRLSFGFFLTSILVYCARLFSIREPIVLSAQQMFRDIVSDAVIAFMLAYFIHILIQQPTRNLFNLIPFWKHFFDHQLSSPCSFKIKPSELFTNNNSKMNDSNSDSEQKPDGDNKTFHISLQLDKKIDSNNN